MFKIVELENCGIDKYVFLTNADSIESQLYDIYDALKDKLGSSFTIIVDAFLRSGYRDNRFIALVFEDGQNVFNYIVDYGKVQYELKRKSFDLIYDDVSLLDDSLIAKRYADIMKNFIGYIKIHVDGNNE